MPNNLYKYLIVAVLTLIAGIFSGYFIAGYYPWVKISPKLPITAFLQVDPKIFHSQTAEIRGVVVKVSGNSVKLKSSGGVEGDFAVSDGVNVTEITARGKISNYVPARDLKINQPSIFNLENNPLTGNGSAINYQLTSLTVIPEFPFKKSQASPSASTKK